MHEKFEIWNELKSLHSRNFHVSHSILIHGSTKIRYVRLNWFKNMEESLTKMLKFKLNLKLKQYKSFK